MLGYVDDVKIVSSYQKESKLYGKTINRATHGFILKIKGNAEYFIDGKTISVNAGDIVFLPKGASYEYVNSGEERLYTSINFNASIENPEFSVYSLEHFHGKAFIAQSFAKLFKFGSPSEKHKCLSTFYELLSYISLQEQMTESEKSGYKLIEPAIEYLMANIFSTDFKISKLHHLCGISDTYFRRLFEQQFEMGPKEFVLRERLSHAKTIIEDGDYNNIKEVAKLVGYEDPLYFSKAFKKYYGFSPSRLND